MTENNEESEKLEGEVLNYEMMTYEGQPARHYPSTGAVMVFSERHNRWIIRANLGGRKDFDPYAMVEARELKKEQAIQDGLEKAAEELDLRGASEVLSAIVAARARNAIQDEGRDGTGDAKFVFSLVRQGSEGDEDAPALRIDMDKEVAERLIEKLIEL